MLSARELGNAHLAVDLERKARRYRELAREVLDDLLRIELEKLASEYEAAAHLPAPQASPRPDPAA
jgi:hypothetical protein